MSLSRTLAHNTAIQIIGKAVSTALGLVAFAILARTLGPKEYGWYGTASGFLQFIGLLIDFGFTVTISNMLAEPLFDKEKLFNTVFTWRFFTALICFGLAPFLILLFSYGSGDGKIKMAVAILALSFFAITVNSVFIGYYRQKLSMLIATLSEVFGRIILVVGVMMLAVFKAGFLPIMGAITIASVSSTIYLIYKFGKIKFEIDKEISRVLYYKMWPTALSVIFNTVYLQADRVILPLYASPEVVGFYAASYRVLDIIIQVAAIVMGMIMPLITFSWSRNLVSEFKERYQLGVDLLAFLLFPMVVEIFVLSQPIMAVIAGDAFAASGEMLKWFQYFHSWHLVWHDVRPHCSRNQPTKAGAVGLWLRRGVEFDRIFLFYSPLWLARGGGCDDFFRNLRWVVFDGDQHLLFESFFPTCGR